MGELEQPQDESKDKVIRKVRPTLLIGLGGTGGDVLLRVRKRFFEKYGKLSEFPIVSYLWIDTDATEKQVIAREFTDVVSFSPNEKVMTTIQHTADIVDHLDNPAYSHIAAWWYQGLKTIPSLTEGAGQVRAYSRLGFFHWYGKSEPKGIREAIHDQGTVIRGDPAKKKVVRLMDPKDNSINIYVICSLAGGTGSGIFLDTAFLAHRIHADAELTGYLVLPRFFGNNRNMDANGYAALKELNYYSTHNFDVAWEPNNPTTQDCPPFQYCYLLDSKNMAGEAVGNVVGNQEAIFEMLADTIFKDFTHGPFADQKRSCRVNVVGKYLDGYHLESVTVHGTTVQQRFPRRFQSLAMASIVMPHDRIITACAYQLAADVVGSWRGFSGEDAQSTIEKLVSEQVLPGKEVRISQEMVQGKQQNQLTEAVGRKREGEGQILGEMQNWINQATDAVERREPAQKRQTIRAFLEQKMGEVLSLLAHEGDNTKAWGRRAQWIEENGEQLKKDATAGIQAFIFDKINSGEYSTARAVAVLQQVAFTLKDSKFPYKRLGTDAAEAQSKIGGQQTQVGTVLSSLDQHERRRNWDGRKGIIISYDLDCWRRAVLGSDKQPGYLRLALMAQIYKKAADVCDSLVQFIEGKLQRDGTTTEGLVSLLRRRDGNLKKFQDRLQRRSGHFGQNRPDDLSLVLYRYEDLPAIYEEITGIHRSGGEQWRPTPEEAKYIAEASAKVLDALRLKVTGLPDLVGDEAQRIEDKMLENLKPSFEPIRIKHHVVLEFEKRVQDDGERSNHVRRMISKSKPLIFGTGTYLANFQFGPGQNVPLIGIPAISAGGGQAIDDACQRLKSMLVSHRLTASNFMEVPDSSEIIFYNEVGGFPINYISEVSVLKEHYEKLAGSEPLHTTHDERKFRDLMVLTPDRVRNVLEAAECLLLGRMFGVIRPQAAQDAIRYHWSEKVGLDRFERSLGDRERALQDLSTNQALRSNLLGACHKILERVKSRKIDICRYYAVLTQEYRKTTTVNGTPRAEEKLPFEKMIAAKVLRSKQDEACDAALVGIAAWSSVEEFEKDAAIEWARIKEFTMELPDKSLRLVLEEAAGAESGR